MAKHMRFIAGFILGILTGVLGFWLIGPSVTKFIAVDHCISGGGVFDYQSNACIPNAANGETLNDDRMQQFAEMLRSARIEIPSINVSTTLLHGANEITFPDGKTGIVTMGDMRAYRETAIGTLAVAPISIGNASTVRTYIVLFTLSDTAQSVDAALLGEGILVDAIDSSEDGFLVSYREGEASGQTAPEPSAAKNARYVVRGTTLVVEGVTLPIVIVVPAEISTISSPLHVEGEAQGSWFFEATFPIELHNAAGAVIATGYGEATSEWMTNEVVPFKGTLIFPSQPSGAPGTVHFKKSNASGLPEYDDSIIIPVMF